MNIIRASLCSYFFTQSELPCSYSLIKKSVCYKYDKNKIKLRRNERFLNFYHLIGSYLSVQILLLRMQFLAELEFCKLINCNVRAVTVLNFCQHHFLIFLNLLDSLHKTLLFLFVLINVFHSNVSHSKFCLY